MSLSKRRRSLLRDPQESKPQKRPAQPQAELTKSGNRAGVESIEKLPLELSRIYRATFGTTELEQCDSADRLTVINRLVTDRYRLPCGEPHMFLL